MINSLLFILVFVLSLSPPICAQEPPLTLDTPTDERIPASVDTPPTPKTTSLDTPPIEDTSDEDDDEDDGEEEEEEEEEDLTPATRVLSPHEIKRLDDNFITDDLEQNPPSDVAAPKPTTHTIPVADEPAPDSPSSPLVPVNAQTTTVVVIQALDKIAGRAQKLRIPVGGMATFQRLRIFAYACHASKPTEAPEAAAFLKIYEDLPGIEKESTQHYSGWMFASSPTIGALRHPVYDVWVETCAILDKKDQPAHDAPHGEELK